MQNQRLTGASRLAIALLASVCLYPSVSAAPADSSWISGQVLDSATLQPLVGATVTVVDRFAGAVCDKDGRFEIRRLSKGVYVLRISHIGHETQTLDGIAVPISGSVDLTVKLVPRPIKLRSVVVAPGSYSLMDNTPVTKQTMTSREIQTTPQLGDDFFRAINRLPGMTSSDFSTRFAIRGGEFNEVMVTLDGLQLTEPFHLKDIDGGAMSIIDIAAVDGIDLMTGGFSAAYGNKMSGVLEIRSRRVPPAKRRLSTAISLFNARALAEGTFNQNKGSWLVSARRGYLDLLLKLAGANENIKPTYYDAFGKLQYQLNDRHILAAHVLHARDRMQVYGEDSDAGDTLLHTYGSSYAWLTLWSQFSSRLTNQLIVATEVSDRNRHGQAFENEVIDHSARDRRDSHFWRVKSDMELEASEKLLLKWGGEYERQWADYDYHSGNFYYEWRFDVNPPVMYLARVDSIVSRFEKVISRSGRYALARVQLTRPLVTEFGVRYDHLTHTGDKLLSPRISLAYRAGENTTLRAGWGYYYQPEDADDIAVQDGEANMYPAAKAEHRIVGLEHEFVGGLNLRLEVYQKKYTHLRPAYRNIFSSIELFMEREEDRVKVFRERANSRGVELLLKKDTGGKVSWWLSYALSKVEDKVRFIYFPAYQDTTLRGATIPTPMDQRHTVSFDVYYRPSPRWQLSAAFQYHSGWPRTDVVIVSEDTPVGPVYWLQAGDAWGASFDPFHRIDLRLDRYFPVGKGRIALCLQLLNAYNRKNTREYSFNLVQRGVAVDVVREPDENWLGRLPSFGVSYEVVF